MADLRALAQEFCQSTRGARMTDAATRLEQVLRSVRSAAFDECAEIAEAVQLLGAEGTSEGAAFADGHSSAQETIARRIRERKDRDA